jgi:aryl-alcohol dehydrogenase-like predicted oxidoreductase
LWDHYYELGGNCFDTAHMYGGGSMETLLGAWQAQRGIREDLVIIGKGAHTPDNHPEAVARQLDESLERLQTDHVDLYFLHRDNLQVPVGEFVDALDAEVRRGRVRAYGGSNWTLPRIRAANEYAAENHKQPFDAVSNQLSLARMVDPIWPGVQTAADPEFTDYLCGAGMALLPWSAQARGFFTDWADVVLQTSGSSSRTCAAMHPAAAELARCWFAPDNFQRRERARRLAGERGADAIQIALAYVLAQPFPCFPLIGPRTLAETRSSIAALDLELTQCERQWLNLEIGSRAEE